MSKSKQAQAKFFFEPSKKFIALTNRDWCAILLITCLYAYIAFYNLGNMKSPENFWLANKNSYASIDFGEEKYLSRVQVLNGVKHDKKLDFYAFDKHKKFLDKLEIKLDTVSDVFTWRESEFKTCARYIKIVCLKDETYIQEIAFRDEHDELIKINKVMSKTGHELFDEQDLVPKYSDYKNSMYFDEVYHGRAAYELLHKLNVYEATHPPLGKNFIALGIKLFGMTPFGWRFFGALCGVLMLPVFYALAKKIFDDTHWATFACLLFAFEFMHFEQTRISTIDSYCVFFIMLMYLAAYKFYHTNFYDTNTKQIIKQIIITALFTGLACAVKWQGFYAFGGVIFILFLNIFWCMREANYDPKLKQEFKLKSSIAINSSLMSLFLITLPIYFATYFLYYQTPNNHTKFALLNNQNFMFSYHTQLKGVTHAFSSRWWQWLFNLRPILFYSHTYSNDIRAGISCFANPVICYLGVFSFVMLTLKIICEKFDKDIMFLIIAYLAQLIPWMSVSRLTFEYHYFPAQPFLILFVTMFVKNIKNHKIQKALYISTLSLSCFLFLLFYPVLSGMPTPVSYIKFLTWFKSWQLT